MQVHARCDVVTRYPDEGVEVVRFVSDDHGELVVRITDSDEFGAYKEGEVYAVDYQGDDDDEPKTDPGKRRTKGRK